MDVNKKAALWQKHFEKKPTDVIQMLSVALAVLGVEYVKERDAPQQPEESEASD